MAVARIPTFDGYIRVSRVNGRSGDSYRSPGDQRAVIERLAIAHGLKLGEIVTEEDVSGSKKAAQRELGRLIEKIENGRSAGLIVWKVSRFSRSLLDGVTTASRISEAGGRLLGEDLDTSAPMGKALLGLMLGLAEEELDARREGWKRATDGAIQRGIYIGITPVGFTKQDDQTLRQNQDAKVIRRVFLARAAGRSWNNLASDLEEAGVKTATGLGSWHMNSVRSLIGNQIYKGTLINGHEHHFANYAIVTAAEWNAAQPSRGKGNHDHAERGRWALLSGFAVCSGCGRALSPGETHKGGKSYRYYRCQWRTCPAPARVQADALDAWVASGVLDALRFFSERGEVTTGRDLDVGVVAALEQTVEDAKARRRKAALALDVDDPADAAALETLAAEVEAAKAALTEALGSSSRTVTPDAWVDGWPTWSLDERRAVLRELKVRVSIDRGQKVPDGVTLSLGDDTDTTSVPLAA
jgi:DNA invertase Pin-like site-specific DNA recombinase